MLEVNYTRAVETRLSWLAWATKQGQRAWGRVAEAAGTASAENWLKILPVYKQTLEQGDTFFMNKHFCELVDHARKTIPEDLRFDDTWLQSKFAWMWLETPFLVPQEIQMENGEIRHSEKPLVVSALGWVRVPEGTKTEGRVAGPGATLFLTYQDFALLPADPSDTPGGPGFEGFGCWSYFMLMNGDKVSERVMAFETQAATAGGGRYVNRTEDPMHEIRWTYAAMYLMAQRLAQKLDKPVDRHTRRRAEKENLVQPPILRVISLRRLEADRKKDAAHKVIDWQWQWEVRGHWRNQFCPSTSEHKPVFIEAYVKGPEDKPLKPPGLKLFVARR